MKRLVFLLTLLFVPLITQEAKITHQPIIIIPTSHFDAAYRHLRKWEGNYGWFKVDRGGETYAGIARNYNKEWRGWPIIDKYKKVRGDIIWNQHIQEVELYALEYYLSVWLLEDFSQIKNQEVAIKVFDMRNHGPYGMILVQRALCKSNIQVFYTKRLDSQTLIALNSADPNLFLENLRTERINFYRRIVHRTPSQKIFLLGWLNRANDS